MSIGSLATHVNKCQVCLLYLCYVGISPIEENMVLSRFDVLVLFLVDDDEITEMSDVLLNDLLLLGSLLLLLRLERDR